jgi:hypothetical protein
MLRLSPKNGEGKEGHNDGYTWSFGRTRKTQNAETYIDYPIGDAFLPAAIDSDLCDPRRVEGSPRDPSSMLSSDVHRHGSCIVRDRWQNLKAYPVLPFG